MAVALILNLFPELGFYFSGVEHNKRWLSIFGIGLMATVLLATPIIVVAFTILHPLINYHFFTMELFIPCAIALVSGFLGASVEYGLGKQH